MPQPHPSKRSRAPRWSMPGGNSPAVGLGHKGLVSNLETLGRSQHHHQSVSQGWRYQDHLLRAEGPAGGRAMKVLS